MGPLRFGVVGCGVIAPTHGGVLRALEAQGLARLVAAVDIDPRRSDRFTSEFGGEPVPTLDDLLARRDIDCVTLCTPSGMHAAMAIKAMRAGKHVLSEKPLDIRVERVDEAIAASREAGVIYGGIFQDRFSAGAQKVKRAIEAGAFGDVVLACAETKWYRSQAYFDSGDWRGTWDLDAGVFSNQGIHRLDMLQWLAGDVEEVVSATLQPGLHRDIEAETVGTATLRFVNGAIGTLAFTTLAYDGLPAKVDVSGTKGCAVLHDDRLAHFRTEIPFEEGAEAVDANEDYSNRATDPAAVSQKTHYHNILDFVNAVRENRRPLVSGPEGRRAVSLLNMVYRAARIGPYA
jgi:UDP-N-acetyl-2-amino-2-deoxyglucuronate dehydrogenase